MTSILRKTRGENFAGKRSLAAFRLSRHAPSHDLTPRIFLAALPG